MAPEPNRIGASTPFDFAGKNLIPYGGLLPVATMLEELGFQKPMEEAVRVKRLTKVMYGYQFPLAMVLGLNIGFSRLNQLRFIARDPMLTGILKIVQFSNPPLDYLDRRGWEAIALAEEMGADPLSIDETDGRREAARRSWVGSIRLPRCAGCTRLRSM